MINYARIMSRVLNQPLLMTPDNLTVFLSALSDRVGIDQLTLSDGTTMDRDEMRATAQSFNSRNGNKPYAVSGGVAIVPVIGTLVNKSGNVKPASGMTGYDSIEARLWGALDDPDVNAVLLDVDSGGGEVAGCFDCADMIHEMNSIKPIWAYAGDLAASAAFAVAAAADKVYMPRTGVVGSVGVVVAHKSIEARLDTEGIKVTLIHSGDHKVDGNPYKDLPDDVREGIQARIDSTRTLFAERIAAYRGIDVSAVMKTEAGVYSGQDAVNVGFADGILSFNEVLGMLKNEAGADAPITVTTSADAPELEETATTETVATVMLIAPEVEAMDAIDLVDACEAANLSQLAPEMIRGEFTEEQVSDRLTMAETIRDLCVAAGVEENQILANLGNPVELVRTMLSLHEEAEINSTHTGDIDNGEKPAMTTGEIWKHRNNDTSANRH